MNERLWFSNPVETVEPTPFVPTFPRRIVGFTQVGGRLFVQCVNGQFYEVYQHYFTPRPSFREWAEQREGQ